MLSCHYLARMRFPEFAMVKYVAHVVFLIEGIGKLLLIVHVVITRDVKE
jgi:hypothetical protein